VGALRPAGDVARKQVDGTAAVRAVVRLVAADTHGAAAFVWRAHGEPISRKRDGGTEPVLLVGVGCLDVEQVSIDAGVGRGSTRICRGSIRVGRGSTCLCLGSTRRRLVSARIDGARRAGCSVTGRSAVMLTDDVHVV